MPTRVVNKNAHYGKAEYTATVQSNFSKRDRHKLRFHRALLVIFSPCVPCIQWSPFRAITTEYTEHTERADTRRARKELNKTFVIFRVSIPDRTHKPIDSKISF